MFHVIHKVKSFKMEDVYVGLLDLKTGIDPVHNDRFRMFQGKCVSDAAIIAHHPVKNKDCMEKLYLKSKYGSSLHVIHSVGIS